ncbi:MAG: aldehyde dehydrogenase family protein, partial [Reichenbachiella sp.]
MMDNYGIQKALDILDLTPNSLGASTGDNWIKTSGKEIESTSPADGQSIGKVTMADEASYNEVIATAKSAFKEWQLIPAPKRGEVVRQFGEALREKKEALGKLVSYEMGKSYQEGLGEVQEMIDICDFAVGLSRQLYGLTMHSERPGHRMYEQYHPLGIVGVISAFNFPVAVWAWNAALAWVCGDVTIWKPSEKTPLTGVACQKIAAKVFADNGVPEGVSNMIIGDAEIGQLMSNDTNIPLVSATGSTRMGKAVSKSVGARLGRALLELGGNNAIIITKNADLNISLIGAVFGAVGTCGQRCTSTRRLIIHEEIYDEVVSKLSSAYTQLKIGNPLDESNHVGPLIDKQAVEMYAAAIEKAKKEGAEVVIDGGVLSGIGYESGCYVKPAV